MRCPGSDTFLAQAIPQMVRTGRWAQLERLRGAVAPEQLFQSIPGLGPKLARRIHEHLDVDTLEALELAAHDGRLEQVPGFGRGGRLCCARPSPGCSPAHVGPGTSARSSPGSICSSRSTASTGKKPSAAHCPRLRPGASIRRARLGFRSFTPNAATGASPLCSRIQRSLMSWPRPRLGGDLFPQGQRAGGAAHGRYGIAQAACRPPRGPRSRSGMPGPAGSRGRGH